MSNCQEWFYLCLTLCGVILAMLAMFFNYNLKLSQKQVELKKEIQEVERVNGKEKRDIAELQAKVKDLENQLSKYEKQ
ncbi:MAG: hypothetical protein LBR43_02400 [Spiroplasmataceae bacterium]|nr:hypothetical protein [Spiroplasmataceae bacterium]